jgi:hypothetical protein
MKKTTQNNCMLAMDATTGRVLASVEYGRLNDECTHIYLHGLDKTFKDIESKREGAPILAAWEQSWAWLYRYWAKWVPRAYRRHYTIVVGGGTGWPRKVIGVRKWHKEGIYSFEYDGGVDKSLTTFGRPHSGNAKPGVDDYPY